MILIVTYDLKGFQDYSELFAKIREQGPWWHYMTTTWLVDTTKSPQDVSVALRPLMGPQDFLLVAEMGRNYQGWLPKEAWDWINSRQAHYTPLFQAIQGLGQQPQVPLSAMGSLGAFRKK